MKNRLSLDTDWNQCIDFPSVLWLCPTFQRQKWHLQTVETVPFHKWLKKERVWDGLSRFTWKTAGKQTKQRLYRYRHTFCDSLLRSGSGFRFRHSRRTRTACKSDSEGQSTTDQRKTNTAQVRPATDRRLYTTVSALLLTTVPHTLMILINSIHRQQ